VCALLLGFVHPAIAQPPKALGARCVIDPRGPGCVSRKLDERKSGRGEDKRTAPIDWEKLSRENPREYERLLKLRHDCNNLRRGGRRDAQKYRRYCGTQQQRQNLDVLIREQYKRLPLPAGTISYQPSWGALVNKPEIFYTTAPATHTYSFALLGHRVRLTTHIQAYTWGWGDGAPSTATTAPGGPYPNFDVTHTYQAAGARDVTLSLTYTASYSVDGGPEQAIPGSVTTSGRPISLTVHSAHSVLVHGSR
jgi:hypothetical protein